MNKFIISENERSQTDEINKINQLCNSINKELKQFKEDTGYSPTLTEVQSLMISSDPTALQKSLDLSLDSQLNKLKITSKLMRENQKVGANEFVKKLQNTLQQFRDRTRYLHNLSIKDGLLFLDEQQDEEIRNSFRNYVTSDTAKEFYEKHKALAESFSDFSKFVKEKTSLSYISSGALANEFFEMDFETRSIEITDIGYERCVQRRIQIDKK